MMVNFAFFTCTLVSSSILLISTTSSGEGIEGISTLLSQFVEELYSEKLYCLPKKCLF